MYPESQLGSGDRKIISICTELPREHAPTHNQPGCSPACAAALLGQHRVIDCDWYQAITAIATAIARIRRNGCLYSGSQSPHNTVFCLNHVIDSGRCQEVPAPQSPAPLPFSCLDCCSRDTGHREWCAASAVH